MAPGMPTPSDPPRVWKNDPGVRGGRYWVTSGENVEGLVEDDRVRRQPGRQGLHELRGVERDRPARLQVGVAQRGIGLLASGSPPVDPPAGGFARGRRQLLIEDDRERREGQPRVGDDAQVDREVLGDLVGVQVDVDHPRGRREHVRQGREDLGEDVRADDQDGIRRGDERPAVVAEHVAEVAAEQRVRLVDVDLG